MKWPNIKLTPDALVKLDEHRSEPPGPNVEAPTGQVARPARVSSPEAQCLPTSRWGVGEPLPLPATKTAVTVTALQPAKAPAPARWVHFELVAPQARTVFLAGSFSGWDPRATQMGLAAGGVWVTDLSLALGHYEYLFVVDGRWTPDPKAKDYAPNPFGGCNSMLKIA